VDKAKFMYLTYAMVTGVPIDFCTHAICVVIDNFHEKVTSLPFGSLITRIATHLRSFYSFFHTPKVFSVVVPLFRSPLPKSLRNIHGLLIGNRAAADMSRGDIASGDSAGASSSGPSVPISALIDGSVFHCSSEI
jgi:hypothetical protein